MRIILETPKYKASKLRESDLYVRSNQRTGKVFMIHREENYQKTRTEKQGNARKEFGNKCHKVSEWLKNPENLSSETYASAERAFRRQSRYSTMRGFLIGNAKKYGIV